MTLKDNEMIKGGRGADKVRPPVFCIKYYVFAFNFDLVLTSLCLKNIILLAHRCLRYIRYQVTAVAFSQLFGYFNAGAGAASGAFENNSGGRK